MNITGHNSYSGCRFCDIQGIYSNKYRHVYFHPKQKGNYTKKNHSNWLACINEIEATTTTKEKELLIKNMVIIIILLLNYYYNLFNLILFTYNFRNKK